MKVLIDDRIQEYAPEEIARWMDELPEWRRERVLAIRHDAGRRQSLMAYRLLCQGVREAYGITEQPTFVYGKHGKPYIKSQNEAAPHFSLSHCREAVACIIDSRPCGIDIEATGRKVSDSLIRYAMNDDEINLINRPLPSEGKLEGWGGNTLPQKEEPEGGHPFLRLWTRKEAVLKLLGTGIRDTMKEVLVDCPYHLETRETERWVMSIATSPSK
ncbi:MAG: 4'-phosphopantetheinyl transferase superfamily protein [Bacteroidaceae bacterium]|nr:4'-phosphopantetheinyl transferase superfamily protein [Bacteroidaceae bacterium]